jgi:hypothetical protein
VLAKVLVLLGLSLQRVFPLAPAGLRPPVHEDRATHGWLDLAADAFAHPEGRDWVAGPPLDLLVVLAVLAENGPVAECAGGEVLFLEGWHGGYAGSEYPPLLWFNRLRLTSAFK